MKPRPERSVNKRCPQPHCFAPEVSCAMGAMSLERCEHWCESGGGTVADGADAAAAEPDRTRLPWTGNAFGASDVSFVAARSSAKVVAIIGAESAGKTTLLAAWYLLMCRGMQPGGFRFGGSYTLEGWENISASLRWSSPSGPTFPPHTSSGAGRHPGLLHMAMRGNSGGALDLLFADAPGEWFTRWAVHRDAPEAQGAQWLAEHADVLLVVADSEALASQQRGVARSKLVELLQRSGAERGGRPAALVWTKSDIEVPAAIADAVRAAAQRHLAGHEEFLVSLHPRPGADSITDQGQGLVEIFAWLALAAAPAYVPTVAAADTDDYFLVYGK
jgi:hypothetical protein